MWTTPREAVGLFCRGVTFVPAARVALVVGTLYSLVNQGHVVMNGDATALTWLRVGFNYVAPFVVASMGFLSGCRQRAADHTAGTEHDRNETSDAHRNEKRGTT